MLAQPNVLFVTVDQWPGQLLGCAGHPVIETPTLDSLARLGTRYPNAFSECPICIPARRSMMTGTAPRTHGDRRFQPALAMPALPTLPQCFRSGGYQTYAIGKLHVYPPRNRIGFDDALTVEEGRSQLGGVDDYEIFLADRGFAGRQFLHGMSNNEYSWRFWHLPEELHVTNWVAEMTARTIRRRDPTRPALWHVSFTHPHPPIVPLQSYFERYRARPMNEPVFGDWAQREEDLPYALRLVRDYWPHLPPAQMADMRRALYALCTHIDHQLRIIVGTLREESILDDTIILIAGDHGDMLGDNGLYAKRYMYQGSAQVPMILMDRAREPRAMPREVDTRLVGLQDVMPTLLDLAGLPVPRECDGISMVGGARRETLYCEALEGASATRMITDGQYKLIWYPAGNRVQLFDLVADPQELRDLSQDGTHASARSRLEAALTRELYGDDLAWIADGRLVGVPAPAFQPGRNRGLSGQRGVHFPPLALDTDPSRVVGMA
jgi:arylsulfatase